MVRPIKLKDNDREKGSKAKRGSPTVRKPISVSLWWIVRGLSYCKDHFREMGPNDFVQHKVSFILMNDYETRRKKMKALDSSG